MVRQGGRVDQGEGAQERGAAPVLVGSRRAAGPAVGRRGRRGVGRASRLEETALNPAPSLCPIAGLGPPAQQNSRDPESRARRRAEKVSGTKYGHLVPDTFSALGWFVIAPSGHRLNAARASVG